MRQIGKYCVLELFHGPTFAFKDVALQLLGHFFDFALRKTNSTMTILGATSGDTGSAAIAAIKGRSNIGCAMLFPLGKISKIQELQMTTNRAANIHCLAVADSVFDDCQNIVKSCFNDSDFNSEMHLGAVNSINWCRIMAQIVYFLSSAARSAGPVSFVVPTGNFGNVLAGCDHVCLKLLCAIASDFSFQVLRSAVRSLHPNSQPCHRQQQQCNSASFFRDRNVLRLAHYPYSIPIDGHFNQL
jgi:threonine synthase